MDYKNNVFGRLLNGFSQLGHWLIGLSNTDISMSAKIGWKAPNSWWFSKVEWIVDKTFYPIDGEGHCRSAYESDDEDYKIGNHLWCDFVVSVLCISGCLILAPLFWGIKKVRDAID